jgi:hypothetical protein
VLVRTAGDLRDEIAAAAPGGNASLLLIPPGARLRLGGTPLSIESRHIVLASADDGATLDAEQDSSVFTLLNGATLELERIHLTRGVAALANGGGGAAYVNGSNITLKDCNISSCVATNGALGGGALLAKYSTVNMINCFVAGCLATNDIIYSTSFETSVCTHAKLSALARVPRPADACHSCACRRAARATWWPA